MAVWIGGGGGRVDGMGCSWCGVKGCREGERGAEERVVVR